MPDYEESIQDLTSVMNEEVEVPEVKEAEEKLEEKSEEKVEEEEEKGPPEEKFVSESPQFKEITKKFPTLFKDFPSLRHMFFHAKEYREIFPSLEEARDAAEELEGLRELEGALTSGEVDDIVGIIDSFKELGEETVGNFAVNFLPALKKIDQDIYYNAITPELASWVHALYQDGLRHENENMQKTALAFAHYVFGDQKIASGEKQVKLPNSTPQKKDDRLEKERSEFRQEKYTSFYNDVVKESNSKLSQLINNGLDPKGVMTDGTKELIAEKVTREIWKSLSSDSSYKSRMNLLWKKANEAGFSQSWKAKIVDAFVENATEIMPRIRATVRSNVLGTRERHSEKIGSVEERKEPKSTTGGGGAKTSSNSKKVVDWSKSSDLDVIKGMETYK